MLFRAVTSAALVLPLSQPAGLAQPVFGETRHSSIALVVATRACVRGLRRLGETPDGLFGTRLSSYNKADREVMAEGMELDPQLRALLHNANLLANPGDDSGIPCQQLRQQYSAVFGCAVQLCHCLHVLFA